MYKHELYHYGVLGMKWGIRRAKRQAEFYGAGALLRSGDKKKAWEKKAKKAKDYATKREKLLNDYRSLNKKDKLKVSAVMVTSGRRASDKVLQSLTAKTVRSAEMYRRQAATTMAVSAAITVIGSLAISRALK
ncbi:MAG: hypothetical protein GX660_04265 [Clostridiaceae bacterium]|nr:hypothetical protein [Clostridiaceae bacterium]